MVKRVFVQKSGDKARKKGGKGREEH